jgi:hypothetical protein
VKDTIGAGVTVTGDVAKDTQPVDVSVNVKVAEPAAIPVTKPASVTDATAPLLLVHVPPVPGDNWVVPVIQMLELPVIPTAGRPLTVTIADGCEEHPLLSLNVKVTVP